MLGEKEFPHWIGCVALKELRQGLRKGVFTIPFAIVHILAILAVFLDYSSKRSIPYFDTSAFLNPAMFFPFPGNNFSCGYLWALIPLCCIIIIPLAGITMMSQELQKGNNELLILTSLKRDRVVIEKFLALWSLSLLTLCSLIPYTFVSYWVNGMRIFVLSELIISIIVHSAVISAMVIAISGYTRIPHRLLFFILIGNTAMFCLMSCLLELGNANLFRHYLNGIIASFALIVLALASAKSQLKLTFFFYEMKPTKTVCVLIFISPVLAGFTALMTFGFIPSLGYLGAALLAWFSDGSTKTKTELARKKLNIPDGTKLIG